MKIEQQVATEVYNEIIVDLMTDYKQNIENSVISETFITEFYNNLSKEKQAEFMLFLDGFAMDIVSIILGGFDGSTQLGKFFGGFSISYENQEMKPYLQDYFLSLYETDFENKSKQEVNLEIRK